ncbi:hypothetical protein ACRAKJ_24840 [Saccharothrix sp. DSM 118769]
MIRVRIRQVWSTDERGVWRGCVPLFRDDYRALGFYGLWQQTQRHVVGVDLGVAQRLCGRRRGRSSPTS